MKYIGQDCDSEPIFRALNAISRKLIILEAI